jgi:hypothetical protein
MNRLPDSAKIRELMHGMANILTAMNAPCYCEEYPSDYRHRVALAMKTVYRFHRENGEPRGRARSRAHKVEGYECTRAPMNRNYKNFLDYKEAGRLLRGGNPTTRGIRIK